MDRITSKTKGERMTVTANSSRRLLGIRAFAAELGIAVPTARRWIAGRRVAVVRLGNRALRVPAEEVDRIIEEGLVPARGGRA